MLTSRLLGYCLEHALNHLVSREDAMLAAMLLEHMLVRLSGEDVMFVGVLQEHALVHVESGDDAMFTGGDDAMLVSMLLENTLVHIVRGEDAMFAGVLSSTSRAARMRCSRACAGERARPHCERRGRDAPPLDRLGRVAGAQLPLVADDGKPLDHTAHCPPHGQSARVIPLQRIYNF